LKSLNSRIRVTWRFPPSWTRWTPTNRRIRRQLRLEQELEQREQELQLLQEQIKAMLQALLLEALVPMAAAMQRQDSQQLQQHQEIRELLLEVLGSLQPTAESSIFRQLGLPQPPRLPPSLETSALR
jgi:hypothetical protein